jgi:hypothetical protein
VAQRFYNRIWRVLAFRPKQTQVGGYNYSHFDYFNSDTNGVEITATRVAFKIEKDFAKEPNTCELHLTNLNQGARHELTRNPLFVHVSAGWEDNGGVQLLFTGDLRHGQSVKDGSEWDTVLQLADGGRAFQHARISRSYKAGTSALTVIRDAARSMGLALPQNLETSPALTRSFPTGIQLHGKTSDELTQLLQPYGYRWTIQNGRLTVLKDDDVEPNQAIVISQETGMIGAPEFGRPEKNGRPPKLSGRAFLNPAIAPGRLLNVRSALVTGIFRVDRVTHVGDSHGSEWVTEFEARATTARAANL